MPSPRPLALVAAAAVLAGCGSVGSDRFSSGTADGGIRSRAATATATASGAAGSGTSTPSGRRHRSVFRGTTIGIDPGHNGRNYSAPSVITRQIWNGRGQEDCNTTGTSTNAGYPESRYTWQVAIELRRLLRRAGARVVMTRTDDHGVGPCVDRRARIINRAHADVAIDIHADGAGPDDRGFAILQPVRSGTNDAVVPAARRYARVLRDSFEKTGMPVSDYLGTKGLTTRTDLAGLNLTTVPQLLIECGNMRNARDAALLTSPRFQHRAARRIMAAMAAYLRSR